MGKKSQDRMQNILQLLRNREEMKVIDLAKAMKVTPETIRKDLDLLQEQGQIVRQHGMARAVLSGAEPPILIRKDDNRSVKQEIAFRAIEEIEDGSTVYLDPGSTILAGVELLRSKKDLTVVVSSIPIALEVLKMGFRVLFLGGVIEQTGQRTEGYFTEEMLDKIHLDAAILGTCGIKGGSGFGVYRDIEIGSRRKILEKAAKTIMVMDHSKFDSPVNFKFCSFPEVDVLVTDHLNPSQRESLSGISRVIDVSDPDDE